MDPLDFLAVADGHRESENEAERRTAVGRYYYAVFNHIRGLLESAGRPVPETAAHYCMRYYMIEVGKKGLPIGTLAATFSSMREDRNIADYDMSAYVNSDMADMAQRRAKQLVAAFAQVSTVRLQGALQAIPRCNPPTG